jgi:hypothetical protein
LRTLGHGAQLGIAVRGGNMIVDEENHLPNVVIRLHRPAHVDVPGVDELFVEFLGIRR